MDVSVDDVPSQLAHLIELVGNGEEVVIVDQGRAVARLLPPIPRSRKEALGSLRGKIRVTEGWDRALTDEESEDFWNGRW